MIKTPPVKTTRVAQAVRASRKFLHAKLRAYPIGYAFLKHNISARVVSRNARLLEHNWDSHKRTLAKSFAWRGIASAITFFSTNQVMGPVVAWGTTITEFFTKFGGLSLYFHDRVWIKAGQDKQEKFVRSLAGMILTGSQKNSLGKVSVDAVQLFAAEHLQNYLAQHVTRVPATRSTIGNVFYQLRRSRRAFIEAFTYRLMGTGMTMVGAVGTSLVTSKPLNTAAVIELASILFVGKLAALTAFNKAWAHFSLNASEKQAKRIAEHIFKAGKHHDAMNGMVRLFTKRKQPVQQALTAAQALECHRVSYVNDPEKALGYIREVAELMAPVMAQRNVGVALPQTGGTRRYIISKLPKFLQNKLVSNAEPPSQLIIAFAPNDDFNVSFVSGVTQNGISAFAAHRDVLQRAAREVVKRSANGNATILPIADFRRSLLRHAVRPVIKQAVVANRRVSMS